MSKGRTGAILASAGALLLAGAVPAFGQVRGAVATASAEICQPVSIQKPADLNFGAMIATRSAGQVVLGPNGGRSATGGVILGSAAGVSSASFQVAGEPHATFTVTLPASIEITSGPSRMTVAGFSTGGTTQALDASGRLALQVGATLGLEANQAPGAYTGSFTVTVAYN